MIRRYGRRVLVGHLWPDRRRAYLPSGNTDLTIDGDLPAANHLFGGVVGDLQIGLITVDAHGLAPVDVPAQAIHEVDCYEPGIEIGYRHAHCVISGIVAEGGVVADVAAYDLASIGSD